MVKGISLKVLALCSLAIVITGCGGKKNAPAQPLSNTYAFHSDAPIAATALACAKAESPSASCTLSRLAPIAFANPSPSVNDIMDRVLVSHDWMGQRFEQLLLRMPEDILYLLGGVTAVVIDDNIRPSYYTSMTGAIYLDPDGLWLTEQERLNVSSTPDYRAEYAAVMAFRALWRYIIPGAEEPADDQTERTLEEIEPYLAALLFHELAHANDIFPRSFYPKADMNQTFVAVTDTISKQTGDKSADNYLSTLFTAEYPLASVEMKRIAEILYLGYAATTSDRMISSAQVGEFFASDSANDEYAYTSQFEDLAMLFEESMMKLHYGADRDVVYANLPAADDPEIECNDYTVGWGMRSRIGDALVKERAEWVVQKLLPHRDYSLMFGSLEEPTLIPLGIGWCASATFDVVTPMHYQKSFYREPHPKPFDPRDALPRSELRMH